MKKINWDNFDSDKEIIEYLKTLPRYKNTALKSLYRRFVFFLTLIICRIFNLNKPIFIVLVTNNGCNLKCTYCYGNYGERKLKDYSTKELLKIIDELRSLGTKLLTLHGGESLLRNDIGEIINYAKLNKFYISLNTNGYLVPDRINEIKNLDTVCLSLDGREENNDKSRGQGCFNKVIEAMDVLQQNNLPVIISATLTKNTMNDIEYLAEFAKNKKIRLQYSILYNTQNLSQTNSDLIMSSNDIQKAINKILDLKRKNYPIYYSDNVLESAINWAASGNEKYYIENKKTSFKKEKLIPCYHGKLKYQIDADGRVISCWAHDNKDAPNVKELGVEKAVKECCSKDKCNYCLFLANNEHNALMHLSPRNILNIARIQFIDSLKIKSDKRNKNFE